MLKYNKIIDENELKLDKLSLKGYRNVDSILVEVENKYINLIIYDIL